MYLKRSTYSKMQRSTFLGGGGGAIIIASKNRPLFFGCFRSSEKLGLPPKKTVLAGALELDPLT